MSRKRNDADNGLNKFFFVILKSERFNGYKKTFKSLQQLEPAIVEYIDYYEKRIKVKQKDLVLYLNYFSNFLGSVQYNYDFDIVSATPFIIEEV